MTRCDATFRLEEHGPIVLSCTLLTQGHDEDGDMDAGLLDVENGVMLEKGLFCELARSGTIFWKGVIDGIERDEGAIWLRQVCG